MHKSFLALILAIILFGLSPVNVSAATARRHYYARQHHHHHTAKRVGIGALGGAAVGALAGGGKGAVIGGAAGAGAGYLYDRHKRHEGRY